VRGAFVLGISVTFILAAYLAAQAFQEDEDKARGYRTLVATRGPRFTLGVTLFFLVLSVILTLGLSIAGWFPRAVLLASPAFLATYVFVVRWRDQPSGGDSQWAAGFFRRLTIAGLLCLALVSADYLYGERVLDGPLGGLGTEAGRPSVRICGRDPASPRLEN
jgi:4-hydroxybenzoate polyprenyltransferase